MLTVRELVTRPHLRLELIVAGDLDREIRWVHSSDMPDPAPYLRGGEVVLTAGIWHWHGVPAAEFAARLADGDAAALGFGVNPLVGTVPDELASACREIGLTLFRVPEDVSFIEIAEEFVEVQHRLRERPLLDSIDRGGQFLYSLQAGGGLTGLLRVLSSLLGGRAAAISVRGRGIVARTGAAALASALAQAAERLLGSGAPMLETADVAAFAVPTGFGEAALAVSVAGADLSVPDRATVDQALAFAAIELQRARAVAETERRFVGELFDLIAAGESQHAAVQARLRSLGLDPPRQLAAVCCESADPERSLTAAHDHLQELGLRGALAIKGQRIVGLVELDASGELESLAERLHAAVGAGARVGVGGVARDARGLARSTVQAVHACRMAGRRRDRPWATYDTLASHAMLLEMQEDGLLDVFEHTLLDPLREHDHRWSTQLVRTLDLFLSSGGRHRETAEQLHVHVNTLRLRLERIEALTGRDLSAMDDRVDLWIALRSAAASRR